MLQVRMTPREFDLVTRAARQVGIDRSAFATQHLTVAAQQTLADSVTREISPGAFDELLRMLDEPPRVLEGLRELASRPPLFVDLPSTE